MRITKPSASEAIRLVESVYASLGPGYAAYWVAPNVVLTLSGARPLCDQVYYSQDVYQIKHWKDEIETTRKTLSLQTEMWLKTTIDISPGGNKHIAYDAIFPPGLVWTLKNTSLLAEEQKAQLLNLPISHRLHSQICKFLTQRTESKQFNLEQIQHIASGIMLGYPDKAILGSVQFWKQDADPFHEPLIAADIRGAAYYPCPQPVYDYPRSMIRNSQIQTHEMLWNRLLKDFYSSKFHKMLAKSTVFKSKIKQLGL